MKHWKTKIDYWPFALASMVGVMVFIAGLDLAVAFLGIEKVASVLGIF